MEFKNVTEWLKMNKLSLNVKKTKAMLFHMPQKKIIVPTIKINGTLEFVDNFNFLGINLNKHLNWNPHVTNVSNKLVKTVGVLNILKKSLPLNILRIIYNALILPHLKLWNPCVGAPSKTTKSDTKTSCNNINRQ